MATIVDSISDKLATWLMQQPVFFVATAPLAGDQHINCSPKGLTGTFTVLGPNQVAYLDLTGSGIETIAHLRENGRIVLMFCAFTGRPSIVRLHGVGRVVTPADLEFAGLIARFPEHLGTRAIIAVDVTRVSDSCGWAVPQMSLDTEREILDLDHAKRGTQGLADYRAEHNAASIDGLPGLVTEPLGN